MFSRLFSSEPAGFSPWGWRVLALMLVVPAAALAQSRPDPRETASMRVGPLLLTPSVQLRNLGIDSNVFNEVENPKSDFTYTLAPRLDLWVPVTRRFLLTTRTELGIVYFQKYANQRSVDPRALVRGDILLHRLTLFAENDYLWARQRDNLETDDRVRRQDNTSRAGLIYEVTSKFSAEVSLYQRTYDYEANFDTIRAISYRAGLNRNERGLSIGLKHRLTSKTTLLLEGETQRTRFDFAGTKNADGFRISPGVTFTPRALIGGTAKVGLRRFTPLNNAVPSFQGVVANLSLGYTMFGATRLTVDTARDLAYSYEIVQPYYISTGVGGSIRRQVRGDIDVVLGTRRTRQAYRAMTTTTAAPRRDLILNYSADIGYRVNRASRLGFVVNWQKRESSAVLRDYRGFTAGLSFTYGS
jgi:hypothetical protein